MISIFISITIFRIIHFLISHIFDYLKYKSIVKVDHPDGTISYARFSFDICFSRFNFVQSRSDPHRFQLYARCQNLNNSLDTYVKIASLSAKLIIYSIMQIAPVTGLISYIQYFISMHLNIYLDNFCILDISLISMSESSYFVFNRFTGLSER